MFLRHEPTLIGGGTRGEVRGKGQNLVRPRAMREHGLYVIFIFFLPLIAHCKDFPDELFHDCCSSF